MNWRWISVRQKLSEDFIERFKDKVNWNCISEYQELSRDFIMRNIQYINPDYLIYNRRIKDKQIFKDLAVLFLASSKEEVVKAIREKLAI